MATARFAALFWGRLLAKVLHDADCAVLTGTHIEEEAAAPEALAFRNILCAVDLGLQSCAAVKWAGELAAKFESRLHVVHALPPIGRGRRGAICTAILDWTFRELVGFSAFLSVGGWWTSGWAI
jgi:hypothetical protein